MSEEQRLIYVFFKWRECILDHRQYHEFPDQSVPWHRRYFLLAFNYKSNRFLIHHYIQEFHSDTDVGAIAFNKWGYKN